MTKLFALIILFASSVASAKESRPIKLSLGFTGESYSIDTKASTNTNAATASFFSAQLVPRLVFL